LDLYLALNPILVGVSYTSEREKTKIPRKNVTISLGIICVALVACLGGVIIAYVLTINDKNNVILSLNTQISQLSSNVTNLKNQLKALNLTCVNLVSIDQINLDPSKWENKTVIVRGKLSGPWVYFTAISYGYVLSSNGTVTSQTELDLNSIGVDFGNRGGIYNSVDAVIVGVVKKGIIGTIVVEAQPTIIYYVEEQAVLLI
jgi:hypothetical protein